MKRGVDSVAGTTAEWLAIVEHPLPDVIGSYANGRFANTTAAKAAFPQLRHVEYDVNGTRPDADILDIEKFDASPATFPGWAKNYKGSLPLPAGYCSASLIAVVVSVMLDHGWKRDQFLIQSAHYGAGQHICGPGTCGFPQADSTQWADKGRHGQNTDLTIYADHFFGPEPPPKPDPHYAWFDTQKRLVLGGMSEVALVREYDRLRAMQHPNKARLAALRVRLRVGASRLWLIAHAERPPSWGKFYRGMRREQLIRRAQGHRII
jgi:hypothetical protein